MNLISPELLRSALDLTQEWCRLPSYRGNEAALTLQARLLVEWLRGELGAEIVNAQSENGRPPLIHARIDMGAANTVILYNMYDVMPAEPAGWLAPPFEGGIVEMEGIGQCLVARGAENNKGPMAGMLVALKALLEAGRLALNVEILLEGEEESGSGAVRDYLLATDCPVRPSRAALFPSFCEYGGGPPRLYLGFSGIARGEISVRGGEWGGPRAPIHSSNAPWIANPASRLIEALALFGRPPTGHLRSIPLDAEAAALIAKLAGRFDLQAELRFRHASTFALDGDAGVLLTHVLSTASANIASLATEPVDGQAVIPSAARAGFDLRCPPPLDPQELVEEYRALLRQNGVAGVEVSICDSYPGYRFSLEADGVKPLIAAYAETAEEPQIWPWAIGAAPAYAFARRAPTFLIGGAGRGGNAHGVNEFLCIAGYGRFLRSIMFWLEEMAQNPERET